MDRVVFGNARLTQGSTEELSVGIANIYVHSDYILSTYTLDSDIALIELAEPVPFSASVRPACLTESMDELDRYRRCMIAGWGQLEPEIGKNYA